MQVDEMLGQESWRIEITVLRVEMKDSQNTSDGLQEEMRLMRRKMKEIREELKALRNAGKEIGTARRQATYEEHIMQDQTDAQADRPRRGARPTDRRLEPKRW